MDLRSGGRSFGLRPIVVNVPHGQRILRGGVCG
jgi:hypothetical protein